MANVKISELPSLSSVNSGSIIPIVQAEITYSSTAQDIVAGGNSFEIVADGSIGGPYTVSYYSVAVIPGNTTGTTAIIPKSGPSFYIDGNNVQFTAQNLSFTTSTFMYSLSMQNCSSLQTISAPLLTTVSGSIDFSNCGNLTSMSFPSLTLIGNMGSLSFGNNSMLTNINFPVLETSGLAITNSNPGITGFRQSMFPALRKASFNVGYDSLPSFEIDFPLLTDTTGNFNGGSGSNLTSINLPNLVNVYYQTRFAFCSSLTNVNLGTVGITKKWGVSMGSNTATVQFPECSLNQASVDNILNVLASLDGMNGTTYSAGGYIDLSGGMNSTPSPSGLMSKMTLQGRGFYVATN